MTGGCDLLWEVRQGHVPGLRIGCFIVPPQMVETFARAKWVSDRHPALLDHAGVLLAATAG